MFRMILWLLAAIVAISFLRGVIGIFGKAASKYVGTPRTPQAGGSNQALKKCASCGVFAPSYAVSQRGGEERHYCSPECQEKADAARR